LKKFIERFPKNLCLTKTELKTALFVFIIFILGFIAKYVKLESIDTTQKKYDYSFQDSLFKALREDANNSTGYKKYEKRVDSKVELSDFSNNKLESKKNNSTQPELKSININTADENTLIKVPGIGKTIANRIISLRSQKGGFKSLNELIEVSRIGSKKLETIKKFFYIEK